MSETITRQTIINVLQAIAPFIQSIDSEFLIWEALQGAETLTEIRDINNNFVENPYRNCTLAFLTVVAERRINNPFHNHTDAKPPSLSETDASPLNEDAQAEELTAITITRIEYMKDTSSGSKHYRLHTTEGDYHDAFLRSATSKYYDSIQPFLDAGYAEIKAMSIGDVLRWNKYPIMAQIRPQKEKPQFYDVQFVHTKPDDAHPDSSLLDGLNVDKRAALANFAVLNAGEGKEIVIIDTETTGTTENDAVVEFAALNLATGEVYQTLINHGDNSRINAVTHINNITEAMLDAAPTFTDVADKIENVLKEKIIVAHNRDFDLKLLRQTWQANERPFPFTWEEGTDTHCTMRLMSRLVGDPGYGDSPKFIGLAEAAELLHIEAQQSHRAMPDVRLTHEVIKAAAALHEQITDDIPW